jgi:predicted regulator of Ras-like GTPase activity (Roadblock/LC7/MglB family)
MGEMMETKLRGILQDLVGDDTRAAAVMSMDGQVVEAVGKGGTVDFSKIGSDLAALLKVGAYCLRKLDGGDLDYVTVTTESLAVLIVSMGPVYYLATVLDAGGNVARARLQIRRRKAEITEQLT